MGTSLTPGSFNGTSQFAGSLQNMIDHAVAVASIPLNQISRDEADLQTQSNEIGTLQNKFGAILTAIQSLSTAAAGQSLTAGVSDDTVATVNLDSKAAVSGGTYRLTIGNPGSHSTNLSDSSLPTVSDPSTASISASGTFTLTVGSSTYSINPAQGTLNSLVQAINASGAPISAALVNLGPPSAPNYRLTLQSTALGSVAIQLNDGAANSGADLLNNQVNGVLAQYQINGQPSISSDSSSVTISPGVTVDLLDAGSTTVTVSPSTTAASDAVSSFVAAFNAASTEVAYNHGNSGGALTGQSLVFELEQMLRNLTSFAGGSGSVQSLADLGVSFNDSTGKLSFDQDRFQTVAAAHPSDLATFLGTSDGTGFLAAATSVLNGLQDPISGLFQATFAVNQQQFNSDEQQSSTIQQRITAMQNSMVAQMTAADTLISKLESQVSYFTTLFADQQDAFRNNR